MKKITPCLWFNDNGEEAARFYVSVFRNSTITDISRYGDGAPLPAGTALTVAFELDGLPFTALNGGPEYTFSEAVSFQIDCAGQEEVDYYWDALAEGGEEGPCGWLKDKFGLSWQVIPDKLQSLLSGDDAEGSQRAFAAMMNMKKLDVRELQRAYDGG